MSVLHQTVLAGFVFPTAECAAPERTLCCIWKCLCYNRACATSGSNCGSFISNLQAEWTDWICLFSSRLCCLWPFYTLETCAAPRHVCVCLYNSSLCCARRCLAYSSFGCICTCLSTKAFVLHLDMSFYKSLCRTCTFAFVPTLDMTDSQGANPLPPSSKCSGDR